MRTEYREHIPYYTVYDRWGLIMIHTQNYLLARVYLQWAGRGHTARTMFYLAKKGLGPAA